jgi:16S rRNA (guanine(966)-N(2))-methyltransferase RsmD
MRVIAGSAKGLRLVAPEGLEVRPTLDRVRESLFNILAPRVEDAAVLDLFAGTGAIAIEALSRGARRAVLVENNREALAAMARNLATTRLQERADCRRLNLPEGLARISGHFDIVFIDPPYSFDRHDELLGGLQSLDLLAPGAEVVVEYRTHSALSECVGQLQQHRTRRYGQTSLAFYRADPA